MCDAVWCCRWLRWCNTSRSARSWGLRAQRTHSDPTFCRYDTRVLTLPNCLHNGSCSHPAGCCTATTCRCASRPTVQHTLLAAPDVDLTVWYVAVSPPSPAVQFFAPYASIGGLEMPAAVYLLDIHQPGGHVRNYLSLVAPVLSSRDNIKVCGCRAEGNRAGRVHYLCAFPAQLCGCTKNIVIYHLRLRFILELRHTHACPGEPRAASGSLGTNQSLPSPALVPSVVCSRPVVICWHGAGHLVSAGLSTALCQCLLMASWCWLCRADVQPV
jgi:hypothetical protein